jgi:hypothetical protein
VSQNKAAKKLIGRPTRWSCLLTDHIQIHLDRHLYNSSVTETTKDRALQFFLAFSLTHSSTRTWTPSQCNADSCNFYLPSSISSRQLEHPQLCTPNLFTSCVHCCCCPALLPCPWSLYLLGLQSNESWATAFVNMPLLLIGECCPSPGWFVIQVVVDPMGARCYARSTFPFSLAMPYLHRTWSATHSRSMHSVLLTW